MLNNSVYVIEEIIKFDKEIFYIKDVDLRTLAFVDVDMKLYFVDKTKYSIIKEVELKIPNDILTLYISKDGKVFFLKNNDKNLYCYTILNEKIEQINTYNTTNLTGMLFSKDGKFLLVFTKSNRIIFYTLPDMEYFTYLEFEEGNIEKYFFSLDSRILVLVFDTKKVVVYDMLYQKISDKFDIEGRVSDGFIFGNNNNIFFTLSEGNYNYCKYNLVKKELSVSHNRFLPLKSCYTDINQSTVLCGNEMGMLFLVNLNNLELLYSMVFDTGIKKVRENDKLIMVLLDNSHFYFFNKNAGLDNALSKLDIKEYGHAFDYIKSNIFLYMNPKVLENINSAWSQLFKRALHFLGEKKSDMANKMLEPFLTIKSKKEKYDLVQKSIESVVFFNEEVKNGRYKSAYNLVDEYPFLKESLNYTNLEKNWEILFEKAQKDFLHDKDNIKNTLKSLSSFLEIKSKQKLVSDLIENYEVFVKAEDAIRNRHFHLFYRYCDKYQFLKNTIFYSKSEELGKVLYQKLRTLDTNDSEFKKGAEYLKFFPTYKSKIEMLINYGMIKDLFIKAIESRNIKSIYHLISENSFLYLTDVYKEFINASIEDFDDFVLSVKNSRFDKAYNTLKPYFNIDFWSNKVVLYMQYYYYKEILEIQNIEEKKQSILIYEELFGTTLIVKYLLNKFNIEHDNINKKKSLSIKYGSSILNCGK